MPKTSKKAALSKKNATRHNRKSRHRKGSTRRGGASPEPILAARNEEDKYSRTWNTFFRFLPMKDIYNRAINAFSAMLNFR
jgi:hypothetical protein